MRKSTWRDFEILLTTIHKHLAPGAEVLHNQFIKGKSGRRRQIDILISQMVGCYKAQIAVECRHETRAVTMEQVEAFVTKLGDVGIRQGAMVSRTGFDAGAKAVAEQHQVTLLTYREATTLDWEAATLPSAWMHLVMSEKIPIAASTVDEPGRPSRGISPEARVMNAGTLVSETIKEFAQKVVKETRVSQRPGEYTIEVEVDEPGILVENETETRFQKLLIRCRVRAFEWVLNVSLGSGHVVTDSASGTTRYREFTSVPWDMQQILSSPPNRELTPETYDEAETEGRRVALVDLSKSQRFVRVVFRPDIPSPGTS